jgi:septal ring factor EnvC (AmiA/AmiB activator)
MSRLAISPSGNRSTSRLATQSISRPDYDNRSPAARAAVGATAMNRSVLVLCLVAITGAVASAALFLRIGNSKQILAAQLADAAVRAEKLQSSLAAANEQGGTLKAQLAASIAELGDTKSRLDTAAAQLGASAARSEQLDRDLAQAKSFLALQEQNGRALAAEIAALRGDLDAARTSNATPEAVAAYKGTIAELERQLANARNGAAAPTVAGAATAVFSSRPGRATVLTVGPSNAFVVLNFGSARGAQIGQRLNVSQGTEVVATVLISDVRANFSIAQVEPATLRGVLQKGDSALLIRPTTP